MSISRIDYIDLVFAARKSLNDKFFKRREDYQTWWRKCIWFFVGKPNIYQLSMKVVCWDERKLADDLHWHMQNRLNEAINSLTLDITQDLIKFPILKDFLKDAIDV